MNRGHLWSSPLIMVSFWMLCKADNYFCNVIVKLHSAVVTRKNLMRWTWLWLSKNAHSLLGIFFSYECREKVKWAAKGVRGAVSTKCDFSCFLWDSPLPQSWHRCTLEKERTWRSKRSAKSECWTAAAKLGKSSYIFFPTIVTLTCTVCEIANRKKQWWNSSQSLWISAIFNQLLNMGIF